MDNFHILGFPVIGYKENKDDDDEFLTSLLQGQAENSALFGDIQNELIFWFKIALDII